MTSGMIQNKEKFLNTVAGRLGRDRRTSGVTRPQWKKQPQWEVFKDYSQDQLLEQLKEQCSRIHTEIEVTTSAQVERVLGEVIERFDGKSLITWDDPRFHEQKLDKYFDKLTGEGKEFYQWEPARGDENIKIAERADIGITFSDMTLAESGTVVLLSDQGKGRSVSLLPEKYIALIPKSTIVPRMTQATHEIHKIAKQEGRFPSCVNFISGPSNSADIEMNLVVGVHGPIQACYIVIEDV
ncbi:LutC/YkgG family protein [Desertibacillus haloalkaliphilus]|uniref:LutC/YkgG family protein n=1 Tax=Desertibacillus haloalkaliphilus TaxID=1328930 RepID=UPI001C2582CC|nr:lactate utilization protein C [Desertibacillus haloalkaliphilus]MBU8905524.1 lactate utilization protein C [Desertibacillus haloalkaliphilus]